MTFQELISSIHPRRLILNNYGVNGPRCKHPIIEVYGIDNICLDLSPTGEALVFHSNSIANFSANFATDDKAARKRAHWVPAGSWTFMSKPEPILDFSI